jgi:Protein of unknown function (DUF2752)
MSERLRFAAASGLAGVVLVFLFMVDPARSGVYPPCLFHLLTGWYCPGCGSARALHQLLHGHLGTALSLNPAAVLVVPLLGGAWVVKARDVVTARPRSAIPISNHWLWLFLGVSVAYWIGRNVTL